MELETNQFGTKANKGKNLARNFLKNDKKGTERTRKGGEEMTPNMKKWRESVRNGAKGVEMTRKGQG
jgi:hypothetical protein